MSNIELEAPYEDYIDKMIKSGYYSSASEVIRDALRKKIAELEDDRIESIKAMILEGQDQINKGLSKKVDKNLFKSILKKGLADVKSDKVPLPHIRP